MASGNSQVAVTNSQVSASSIGVKADGTAKIRIANNGFFHNSISYACGAGTLVTGGNNLRGGGGQGCPPSESIAFN